MPIIQQSMNNLQQCLCASLQTRECTNGKVISGYTFDGLPFMLTARTFDDMSAQHKDNTHQFIDNNVVTLIDDFQSNKINVREFVIKIRNQILLNHFKGIDFALSITVVKKSEERLIAHTFSVGEIGTASSSIEGTLHIIDPHVDNEYDRQSFREQLIPEHIDDFMEKVKERSKYAIPSEEIVSFTFGEYRVFENQNLSLLEKIWDSAIKDELKDKIFSGIVIPDQRQQKLIQDTYFRQQLERLDAKLGILVPELSDQIKKLRNLLISEYQSKDRATALKIMTLTNNILERNSEEHLQRDLREFVDVAMQLDSYESTYCKSISAVIIVLAGLMIAAGALALAVGVPGLIPLGIGLVSGGVLSAASGYKFFKENSTKGLAKEMINLSDSAYFAP